MIRALLLPVLLVTLAGCDMPRLPQPPASQTVPQLTLIEAVPHDARCRVVGRSGRRDMQAAPLSIDPRRLGFPIEVSCEAPGYLPTSEILHPRPKPDLLSVLAARRQISPMADNAPAAGAQESSEVPYRLLVPLRGAMFASADDRAAFYEALRQDRIARWTALHRRAETECGSRSTSRVGASSTTLPEVCRRAFAWFREIRDADLRQLEIDRRRASFR